MFCWDQTTENNMCRYTSFSISYPLYVPLLLFAFRRNSELISNITIINSFWRKFTERLQYGGNMAEDKNWLKIFLFIFFANMWCFSVRQLNTTNPEEGAAHSLDNSRSSSVRAPLIIDLLFSHSTSHCLSLSWSQY